MAEGRTDSTYKYSYFVLLCNRSYYYVYDFKSLHNFSVLSFSYIVPNNVFIFFLTYIVTEDCYGTSLNFFSTRFFSYVVSTDYYRYTSVVSFRHYMQDYVYVCDFKILLMSVPSSNSLTFYAVY